MPPTTPPQPDGGWNPDQAYGQATSTTGSGQTDIWNLPTKLAGQNIIVDYGHHVAKGLARHLPGEDVAANTAPPSSGSLEDLMGQPIKLFSSAPKDYLALQRALFQAGYYGSTPYGSIAWGSYTNQTVDAWRQLLVHTAQAQSQGINATPNDILHQSANNRVSTPKSPGPLIVQHGDPKVVAGFLQQAAQSSLGRNLSDQEVAHFISEYRTAETAYYEKAQQATNAPAGRFDLTKPSPEADAQSYVAEQHPTEAAGNDMGDYVRQLESMLGGV